MSLTSIKVPSSRHLNEHRISRFEKNPSFNSLSNSEKYKSREDYCKILGWELINSDNVPYFYNSNTNQRARIFIKKLDTGEKVYLPVSDEPDVTLAYNLVVSGCGSYCYVRPNEWNKLGYVSKKNNKSKKTLR